MILALMGELLIPMQIWDYGDPVADVRAAIFPFSWMYTFKKRIVLVLDGGGFCVWRC